jgi:alkylation response protein AidB-like acyl-CoA dehydrogenase
MLTASFLCGLIAQLPDPPGGQPDPDTMAAILESAARFAEDLAGSGVAADRAGCRLVDGRVAVPPGQHRPWAAFLAQGWNTLSAPEIYGGQELPLTVAAAAQMLFDGSDIALGMLALNQRCAVRLLQHAAGPDVKSRWIPRFVNGEWGATICVSEPQAGSDVGRIRTRAVPDAAGNFRITGQKCWISYGDHDLTPGIVHFILARAPDMPAGTRGLSLFLLPDRLEDGSRNGVTVLRIEEKLGLHASPTCLLDFDGALAIPLGAPGQGLAALFGMIAAMRLGVAGQGSALALRAADLACLYAAARAQGGPATAPPVPIHTHAEVRRMLLEMRLAADSMAALTLQAAAWVDAGDRGDAAATARAAVLLPVVKTLAAEAAFDNAHLAIQVLGGAGYTREWPAERLLRDSRIFSIYEGTSAIQALDLTFRQILGGTGRAVWDVLDRLAPSLRLRKQLEAAMGWLMCCGRAQQERAALPLLRLFGMACTDGILRRGAEGGGALAAHFAALLAVHESLAEARVARLLAECHAAPPDGAFETLCLAEP